MSPILDPVNYCMTRLPLLTLWNGPKGVGKTTLINALSTKWTHAIHTGLAAPIYDTCMVLNDNFNPGTDWSAQSIKNSPVAFADSDTYLWRDFMVDLGNLIREKCGGQALGKILVESIRNELYSDPHLMFLVDNVRFTDEIAPLLDAFEPKEILLIRLRREGYTWEGDIGEYIELSPSAGRTFDLTVTGDPVETIRNLAVYLSDQP